jgi:hypothetical protein
MSADMTIPMVALITIWLAYGASVVDLVVRLDRNGGQRRIAAIADTRALVAQALE